MPEPRERTVAAMRMNRGEACFHTSVRGEPRGPLCGMGTCFECRTEIDGVRHERACMRALQQAPPVAIPERCDTLVVGAGPAGLAAARAAAARGQQVVLLDDQAGPGGQIWRGMPGLAPAGVTHVPHATVIGPQAERTLLVDSPSGARAIAYTRLILATGACELFLPFPGWTQTNVLGAGGLQALVKSGLEVRGKRIVVAGSGPLLLAVAKFLQQQGAVVLAVLEQAPLARVLRFSLGLVLRPAKLLQGLRLRQGLPYRCGEWVTAIAGARVSTSAGRHFAVDLLACAYGLVPNTRLLALLPDAIPCGEMTGIGGVDKAVLEGEMAGSGVRPAGLGPELAFAARLARAFALRPELRALPRADTIVCRCEDVTLGELSACSSWRDAKLQTRCGMGACQGRVCGPAAHFLFGWPVADARPPVFQVALQSLSSTLPSA